MDYMKHKHSELLSTCFNNSFPYCFWLALLLWVVAVMMSSCLLQFHICTVHCTPTWPTILIHFYLNLSFSKPSNQVVSYIVPVYDRSSANWRYYGEARGRPRVSWTERGRWKETHLYNINSSFFFLTQHSSDTNTFVWILFFFFYDQPKIRLATSFLLFENFFLFVSSRHNPPKKSWKVNELCCSRNIPSHPHRDKKKRPWKMKRFFAAISAK